MLKGQGTEIQTILMILLILAIDFFIAWFITNSGSIVREMNIAEAELIKTIDTYYLTQNSLETTWFVSSVQAIFKTAGSALGEDYWYQTDPSRAKNINPASLFIGLSGCTPESANPKMCNLEDVNLADALVDAMQEYVPGADDSYMWDADANGVDIFIQNLIVGFAVADDQITSEITHTLGVDYANGKVQISSGNSYDSVIETYLNQIVGYGKMIVEKAIELAGLDYSYTTYKEAYLNWAGDTINEKFAEVSAEIQGEGEGAFEQGQILRIKIDPVQPTKTFEFYLTDTSPSDCQITGDDLSDSYCDVCVTNYDFGLDPDEHSHWKIMTGGKIPLDTDTTKNIYDGIEGRIEYYTEDKIKASPYPFDHPEAIGGDEYDTVPNDECGNCPYLKEVNGDHYWSPLYEIICDDGYWKVCDREDSILYAGDKTYRCEGGKWIPIISFSSDINLELIAPRQAYGTAGLLPDQTGLLLHYDITGSFADPEEKYYYHDEANNEFVKKAIALEVQAEDYFVALDCSGLEQRFYYESKYDMLCYGDELYTCARDIIDNEERNTIDSTHEKQDSDMVGDYLCVTCNGQCNRFCAESERANVRECCIGWPWNDGLPIAVYCGYYCNGDGELTPAPAPYVDPEICDFRIEGFCQGCAQKCESEKLYECSQTDCLGYVDKGCSTSCGGAGECEGRQPYECFGYEYCDDSCNKQSCGNVKQRYCDGIYWRNWCTETCTGNPANPCDCDGEVLDVCTGTNPCLYYYCNPFIGCDDVPMPDGTSCVVNNKAGQCLNGNCIEITTTTSTTTTIAPSGCCYFESGCVPLSESSCVFPGSWIPGTQCCSDGNCKVHC